MQLLCTLAVITFFVELAPAYPASLQSQTNLQLERFMAVFAPSLSTAGLSQTEVPAIGCPQDGQVGPVDAPALPKTVSLTIPEGMGQFVAFYSASEGTKFRNTSAERLALLRDVRFGRRYSIRGPRPDRLRNTCTL